MRTTKPFLPQQAPVTRALVVCMLAAFFLAAAAAQSATSDPAHTAGWIVISVGDYQSLRTRAFPAELDPDPPPVDATLTRVEYDLHVTGDLASGRASLTVDVLKDGWVRVPIPAGLLVREARLDGKLVALAPAAPGKGGGLLSAVLAHAGRAVLLLDIALPVISASGEESISLPATASGVTRAAVKLPRQGVEVQLSGGLLAESPDLPAPTMKPVADTASTEARWVAYGRGNEPLTFTWRRKLDDHRLTQPLRLRGALTQMLGLGEDSTSVYAEVDLEVTQGAMREVKIGIPEKVTINQVAGAMVADWEVKANQLMVTFLEPVESSARFVITGETRTARDGPIDIPLLRLLEVERDTGGVAVEVMGAGEIKDLKSQGLESADASELGEIVAARQSPSLVAFRVRPGDAKSIRKLSVNVARYDQQAVLMANVEEARYHVLLSKEGKTLVQARYAIRNNQRNFLKITLPAGAAIWSASLAGKPVRPGQSPDGSLLLPLEKMRAGEDTPAFVLEFIYLSRDTAWSDKGKVKLALPALDLPVSRTGVLLYHPPLFRVTTEPGSFRTQPYEGPVADVLRPGGSIAAADGEKDASPKQPEHAQRAKKDGPQSASQALVDDFKNKALGGTSARILPIRISFPAFGPSLYMVSELTGENQAPAVELSYLQNKKEGGR
ncbi:MAG TPA: hypothetical protein VNW97_10870 [Candidatus Saccharimonadales bacterium]|jgi:hypothetical protein|nr:hypothetical protein [Candidatus Saccharimonadales bacterium]